MNTPNKPQRLFHLGLITALACSLAAFEWTVVEWGQPAGWEFQAVDLLEEELVPTHVLAKPRPPVQNRILVPVIHPDPSPSVSDPAPRKDPLLGKIQEIDFDSFWEEEPDPIETVFIAEHMPHFEDCSNLLDRASERTCTESRLIGLIQSCAKFPPLLKEARIGGVVFVQFNVDEFGRVTDSTVLKGSHPQLDQAALDALSCIPPMVPGSQQGQPVRVTYTIPVRFTIR